MRRIIISALLALTASACAQTFTASAAVVNGVRIDRSEIDTQIDAQIAANPSAGDPATRLQLERDLLTGLIRQELLRQVAVDRGIEASEADIDTQIADVRSRFGSEKEFQDRLAAAGLDEETLRDRLALQILQQGLAAELGPSADEDAIRARYEANSANYREVDVSHILYAVGPDQPEERAKAKAEAALSVIRAGTSSFAELAKTSDDTQSAKAGGSLGGFLPLSSLDEAFGDAAWEAPIGQVVGPIRSSLGFHLILTKGKRKTPLAQVRDQIEQELAAESGDAVLGEAVSEAAAKANILVNPSFGDWDPETQAIVAHESYQPVAPAPEPSLPVVPDFSGGS